MLKGNFSCTHSYTKKSKSQKICSSSVLQCRLLLLGLLWKLTFRALAFAFDAGGPEEGLIPVEHGRWLRHAMAGSYRLAVQGGSWKEKTLRRQESTYKKRKKKRLLGVWHLSWESVVENLDHKLAISGSHACRSAFCFLQTWVANTLGSFAFPPHKCPRAVCFSPGENIQKPAEMPWQIRCCRFRWPVKPPRPWEMKLTGMLYDSLTTRLSNH